MQSSRDNRLTRCSEHQRDPFHAHLACGSQLKCKLHCGRCCRLQLIGGYCWLLLDAVSSLFLLLSQHRQDVDFFLADLTLHFAFIGCQDNQWQYNLWAIHLGSYMVFEKDCKAPVI